MRVLAFQHMAGEHPAWLGEMMARRGIGWTAVRLDAGEPVPDLTGFDALLVMGGAMNVWERAAFPWLTAEMEAIRHWVCDLSRPYFGVCLGHQLLAAALGGEVGPAARPETGIVAIDLLPAAGDDPLLGDLSSPVATMHWHGAEVVRLPDGAIPLARSADCAVQAMRVGARAWGVQYHPEVTGETLTLWTRQPAFAGGLRERGGPAAVAAFAVEAEAGMAGFHRHAEQVFGRFLALAGDAHEARSVRQPA